jgi:large subunit ribosomal protein L20
MHGLRYSQMIAGLTNAHIELDRKSLSQLAIHDMDAFKAVLELAKKHMPAGLSHG